MGPVKEEDTPKSRQRASRIGLRARLWDRSVLKEGQAFETYDGACYALHPSGAFVRTTNKDRRSKKERNRARREARAVPRGTLQGVENAS
jgi:hypothetical protein